MNISENEAAMITAFNKMPKQEFKKSLGIFVFNVVLLSRDLILNKYQQTLSVFIH